MTPLISPALSAKDAERRASEGGDMTDIVNAYFKRFYPPAELLRSAYPEYTGNEWLSIRVEGYRNIFPEMVCKDGLRLSVQGHYGAYSSPRDDWADEYSQVEVMCRPDADELFANYDNYAVGDEVIYPFMPVKVVAAVIEKHGGLVDEVTP
jgi:hypothetical protein